MENQFDVAPDLDDAQWQAAHLLAMSLALRALVQSHPDHSALLKSLETVYERYLARSEHAAGSPFAKGVLNLAQKLMERDG